MSSYVKFREVRGEVDSARLRGLGEDREDELLFNAERIGLKITAGHIEPRMAQIVPQPDVKAVSDFLVCLAAISPHPEQVRICYFAESGSMECWQWGIVDGRAEVRTGTMEPRLNPPVLVRPNEGLHAFPQIEAAAA